MSGFADIELPEEPTLIFSLSLSLSPLRPPFLHSAGSNPFSPAPPRSSILSSWSSSFSLLVPGLSSYFNLPVSFVGPICFSLSVSLFLPSPSRPAFMGYAIVFKRFRIPPGLILDPSPSLSFLRALPLRPPLAPLLIIRENCGISSRRVSKRRGIIRAMPAAK